MNSKFPLELEADFFRCRREWPAARLPGFDFQRGHFSPDRASLAAQDFFQSLLAPECEKQLDDSYLRAKQIWGWRSRDMERSTLKIKTPHYSLEAKITQVVSAPAEARLDWEMKAALPVSWQREHNIVLPLQMEEWVMPVSEALPFANWVDGLEDMAAQYGGQVWDNPRLGWVEYKGPPELGLRLRYAESEFIALCLDGREGTAGLFQLREKLLPILRGKRSV